MAGRVISELRKLRIDSSSGFDWWGIIFLAGSLFFIYLVTYIRSSAVIALLVSLAWVGFIAILIIIQLKLLNSYEKYIRRQLHLAPLVEKLTLGPEHLREIYRWTPLPWRWLMLGFEPRTIQRWVIFLAYNLEWYLDEPKLYFRWEWIFRVFHLISIAGLIACSHYINTHAIPQTQWLGPLLYLILVLGNLSLWLASYNEKRKQIAVKELLSHFKSTMES